jgi:raffinose/stachyose/melibiose transport system substrate-binding protein
MYSGAMTPDDVMNSISKRRDDQAKLQKDPAWVK